MIVLVIAGILLAVGMPNFLSTNRRNMVEATAYEVQSTLELTRRKALAQRRAYRVTLDTAAKSYIIERHQGGGWVPDGSGVHNWNTQVELLITAGGSFGNSDIIIEPRGTVRAEDAPAILTFTNAHGDTTLVSFVRTGRLRVET
jgi:Tfp pilus assembly protein FimT